MAKKKTIEEKKETRKLYRQAHREHIREYYREYYKAHREVINLQRKVNYAKKGKPTNQFRPYKPRGFYKRVIGWVVKNDIDYYTGDGWSLDLLKAKIYHSKNEAELLNFSVVAIEIKEKVGEQQVINIKGDK